MGFSDSLVSDHRDYSFGSKYLGAILTDDLVGIADEKAEDQANAHERNEGSVCTIDVSVGVIRGTAGERTHQ